MELFARPILPYVDNGLEEATNFAPQDAELEIPREVLNDIQEWLQTNTSSVLWVEGPVFPSDLSPVAFRVWAVMADAGIPSICFYDQQRYPDPHRIGVIEAGIVCLLYTLVDQLIHQLPSVIETEEDMDNAFLSKLDGSWASTEFALEVIRRFLSYAPPSIVLVIHGLEALEGRTTRDVMGQLVDIIREQSFVTVVKAFFTTNGMSQVLGDKTVGIERVDASRMSQGRPGRILRGAGSLDEMWM